MRALTLLHRSLPHATQLTLVHAPLTPLLLLTLDRFQLTSLTLSKCEAASHTALTSFASSTTLRRLKALTLDALPLFDDAVLLDWMAAVDVRGGSGGEPQLEELTLHALSLSGLSGPAFSSLSRFARLTVLSLDGNAELTDSCIKSLASTKLPLTVLSLQRCAGISTTALSALTAFPALSSLNVSNCPRVTSLDALTPLPITSLSIAHTAIPPSALASLSYLPFSHLHVSGPIPPLPQRRMRLHLVWEDADDDGLARMAALGVMRLEVSGKKVGDRGIDDMIKGYRKRLSATADDRAERKDREEVKAADVPDKDRPKSGRWFGFGHHHNPSGSQPPIASPALSSPLPHSPLSPLPSASPQPSAQSALLTLALRSTSVTDRAMTSALDYLLPLGLREVSIAHCPQVTWRMVERVMKWRRERGRDVSIVYEL